MVLACALLTFGGVSLFVVSFAVLPIADALFRQANIPHRLIPATIALEAFTFTMTALPGTPAIQNAVPMPHFGATLLAAPGIGILAALVILLAICGATRKQSFAHIGMVTVIGRLFGLFGLIAAIVLGTLFGAF